MSHEAVSSRFEDITISLVVFLNDLDEKTTARDVTSRILTTHWDVANTGFVIQELDSV